MSLSLGTPFDNSYINDLRRLLKIKNVASSLNFFAKPLKFQDFSGTISSVSVGLCRCHKVYLMTATLFVISVLCGVHASGDKR